MKYMLMMHYGADCGGFPPIHTWDPKDIQAHIAFMLALNERLSKRGEFVDAQGLTDPGQAKLVRARQGGGAAITDGPFPEGKEFLAGFWIVDVENERRALEIAAEASAAPGPKGARMSIPIELRGVGTVCKPEA